MSTVAQDRLQSPDTKWPLVWTGLALLGALGLFWPTLHSIVAIWSRSETFAHGYLIVPISAYLIWQRRQELLAMTYSPDWRAAIATVVAGFVWLLAHAGGVLVVEQYAFVSLLICIIWGLLGWRVVWSFFFPLAFLLFAVPFGEFLIPPLMEFTADFTVAALQLTGIPVYREGLFFTIPSGQWSVVEGCSGLRYLIASFTLGTLYAYLTYRSFKRRLLFSLLAIVVPIIANGFRAYMIVMIGHLSDMKLAMGVDHFIYGWVWFGIVMLLMFWVGAFWRQDHETHASSPKPIFAALPERNALPKALVLTLLVILPWPLYAYYLDARAAHPWAITLSPPPPAQGWTPHAAFTDWQPLYQGPSAKALAFYGQGDHVVGTYLAYYPTQTQDAELVNTQNLMIRQKDPVWANMSETWREIVVGKKTIRVKQTLLRSAMQQLLIWEWHHIDGRQLNNAYWEKLLLAFAKVFGGEDDGSAIVIFTAYPDTGKPAQAAAILEQYIADMLPGIEASLNQAAEQVHGK